MVNLAEYSLCEGVITRKEDDFIRMSILCVPIDVVGEDTIRCSVIARIAVTLMRIREAMTNLTTILLLPLFNMEWRFIRVRARRFERANAAIRANFSARLWLYKCVKVIQRMDDLVPYGVITMVSNGLFTELYTLNVS